MEPTQYGPQEPFSNELHAGKYRQPGEDFREAMNRLAFGLADNGNHYQEVRPILLDMRFMPAGRIQSAIGSDRGTTPYNCYVSGAIEDTYVDGPGSIMQRALEAAATMRMGGGIGYDFSTLRPSGDLIVKLQSKSSGPLSFMEIYDAVCRCTSSSGHRRGAQMGVLRVDHPDIMAFVRAKNNRDKLTGFNMSIAVTDDFMRAKAEGKPFNLTFKGRVYKTVDPSEMWEAIMRSTWDWAEPGVLFIDTINRMNNLYYCETLAATNPCGEQPLPPYGACLLGSFNLTKYMRRDTSLRQDGWYFDWGQFEADIPPVVRAMDNVVDRARYPLPQQHDEAKAKRRMGLGVTGLANAAEAMGLPYGTPSFIEFETQVIEALTWGCYRASALLAKDKGPFPKFDVDKYMAGQFVRALPPDIQALIRKHGIRNSHLTSIAPTGTISLCADNISSSIEPVFSYQMERTVIDVDGPRVEVIQDYGVKHFGVRGKRSADVTIKEHVDVLAAASRLVDSAVSKTCNTNGKLPWDEFKGCYDMAWERGCKGITTFNQDGKRFGVIVAKDDDTSATPTSTAAVPSEPQGLTCEIGPDGRKSCE